MRKVILFLLLPVFLFAQTYWADLPCTDNAATTTVTNNGTGGAWATNPIHTTSTYAHISYGGNFWLQQNSYYIKSTENWSGQKISISWTSRFVNATAAAIETYFCFGDADGNRISSANANSLFLIRLASSDEFTLQIRNADNVSCNIATTDHSTDNTTIHNYTLSVDLSSSPATVSMTVDGIALTFGAWSTEPSNITLASDLVYVGEAGVYEPDVFINDVKIWQTPESSTDAESKFRNYSTWNGFKP